MQNLWSDKDAGDAVRKYAASGINEDLALRVYTTRLLGGDPRLVQHGGGNTSVKTKVKDAAGNTVTNDPDASLTTRHMIRLVVLLQALFACHEVGFLDASRAPSRAALVIVISE